MGEGRGRGGGMEGIYERRRLNYLCIGEGGWRGGGGI